MDVLITWTVEVREHYTGTITLTEPQRLRVEKLTTSGHAFSDAVSYVIDTEDLVKHEALLNSSDVCDRWITSAGRKV